MNFSDGYTISFYNYEEVTSFLKELGIPISSYMGTINPKDLYDIFMDREKSEVLFKRLKNKAFW